MLLVLSALGATHGVQWPSLDAPCATGLKYMASAAQGYGGKQAPIGGPNRGGWRGAVLGPDGTKVYGIPTNATQVLEIDPTSRTVTTFGNLGRAAGADECRGQLNCGEDKWIGGVLTKSGKIIGIPYAAESVLEIDPKTRTATTWGVIASEGKRKWVEGVLGRNGMVYAIPFDANGVLEIDPETRALMMFGFVGTGPCKWYGGVLAPNGKSKPRHSPPAAALRGPRLSAC